MVLWVSVGVLGLSLPAERGFSSWTWASVLMACALSCSAARGIFPEGQKVKSLSRIRLFATPWTVAHQASPFMGFSRQEYWSGLPSPFPEDLPDPGVEPRSPTLQADALPPEPPGKPQTRDQTCVPCIAGQILNHWTTREVQLTSTYQEFNAFTVI